jgi:hypothetical protein
MAGKAFDVQAEISEIADLGREELVAHWVKAHGCAPPKGVRQEFLVRSAAWHLQAKRLGGYSAETRRLLRSAIIEVSKRFADRTGASRSAGRVEGKGRGNPVHRLEHSHAVDAPPDLDQYPAGTIEGDETRLTLSMSHNLEPPDCSQEPEQQLHQSSAVSWTAGGRDQSISPLPPSLMSDESLATSNNSSLIMADISRPPQAGAVRPPRKRRKLQPGARLLRDWNGKTHVVDVIEGGYVFEAKVYPSLTAIAGKITGVHWSGPRFFGL